MANLRHLVGARKGLEGILHLALRFFQEMRSLGVVGWQSSGAFNKG